MMPWQAIKSLVKPLVSRLPLHRCLPSARLVFCYHDISRPGDPGHSPLYSTPPDLFERQLDYLSSIFEWRSLDELTASAQAADGAPRRRPQAALTFDDGFASVLTTAAPILERRRIPFAVFACQSAIEDNFLPISAAVRLGQRRGARPFDYGDFSREMQEQLIARKAELRAQGILDPRIYLTAVQLRELRDRGATIGSHGRHHRVLSSCTPEELREEITGNQACLSAILGAAPRHFAIPYGKPKHFDRRSLEIMAECGIRCAYLTARGTLPAAGEAGSPRLIPRLSFLREQPREIAFAVNLAIAHGLAKPARGAS